MKLAQNSRPVPFLSIIAVSFSNHVRELGPVSCLFLGAQGFGSLLVNSQTSLRGGEGSKRGAGRRGSAGEIKEKVVAETFGAKFLHLSP